MFVYINKRSLVGIRDIPSQFGCSVFGQEDHHGTHDTSSHQAIPAFKRDHHSAGERVRSYKIQNPKLSMPVIVLNPIRINLKKKGSTRSKLSRVKNPVVIVFVDIVNPLVFISQITAL